MGGQDGPVPHGQFVETEYEALVQPHTGLISPVLMRDRLAVELARAQRTRRFTAALVFPLPRRHDGAPVDAPALSQAMRARLRPEDSIGCLRDGRVMVLLGSLRAPDDATRVAQRLTERLPEFDMPMTVVVSAPAESAEAFFARVGATAA